MEEDNIRHWYNDKQSLLTIKKSDPSQDAETVMAKMSIARGFLTQHMWSPAAFSAQSTETMPSFKIKGVNNQWLMRALRGPMNKDRVNALSVLIREEPTRCGAFLEQLVELITPAKKSLCRLALDALTILFREVLLPKNRTLIPFEKRPLTTIVANKQTQGTLCLWLFEEDLHQHYLRFIANIENLAIKDIDSSREVAIKALFQVVDRPDARERVLKAIVNKFGDRSKKIASSVVYRLVKFLRRKPAMCETTLTCVEELLLRPHVNVQAQRNCINLLSVLVTQKQLAIRQITLLTAYFHHLLTQMEANHMGGSSAENKMKIKMKKMKVDSEALPSRDMEDAKVLLEKGKLKKAKTSTPTVMDESLKLLSAVLRALTLALPHIGASQQIQGLEEHVVEIFRIAYNSQLTVSFQALQLLHALVAHSLVTRDRFAQCFYRKLSDADLRRSTKLSPVMRLLEDVLMEEDNASRWKALCKRALQLCLDHPEPGVAAAILMIISKVASEKPLMNLSNQRVENGKGKSSKALIIPDDPEDVISNVDTLMVKSRLEESTRGNEYDPKARNPAFARADLEPFWELSLLTRHSHPTVALFATRILQKQFFTYEGDPFVDFSTIAFLNRWVFKNPKNVSTMKKSTPAAQLSLNSQEYATLPEEKIPEHEKCFHRYFKQVVTKGEKRKHESDSEVSDSEFYEYLDKHNREYLGPDADLEEDEDVSFDYSDDPDLAPDSDMDVLSEDDDQDDDMDPDGGLFASDEEMEVESD